MRNGVSEVRTIQQGKTFGSVADSALISRKSMWCARIPTYFVAAAGWLREAQLAIPIESSQRAVWIRLRTRNIFAACKARDFGGWGAAEYFLLWAECRDAAAGQHEQLFAEAIGFLHVVGYEQRGAAERGECFLELGFHLPAEMRIES